MSVAQIFKALGDPARLEIVRRLANGSTYTVGALSKDLGMSRQGARKQMQVLVEAKVIQLKPHGRETEVVLDATSLMAAKTFISAIESQWDNRLAALKAFTESNEG